MEFKPGQIVRGLEHSGVLVTMALVLQVNKYQVSFLVMRAEEHPKMVGEIRTYVAVGQADRYEAFEGKR